MIQVIRHGKGPMGRVVRQGQPIAYPKQAVIPITGAPYSYLNQAIPGAATGTVYHNAPNLTLDISSLDKNGVNHYTLLETLPPGCTITIGTQSALMPVKPTYVGGGMWNLTVDAWPTLPDGDYNITVTPPAPLAAPIEPEPRMLVPEPKKKGKRK